MARKKNCTYIAEWNWNSRKSYASLPLCTRTLFVFGDGRNAIHIVQHYNVWNYDMKKKVGKENGYHLVLR